MNVERESLYGYACTCTTPSGVSAMMNVKAVNTWSVPNQAYVARRWSSSGSKPYRARSVEFTPSAATTRSPSSSVTSLRKRRSTPSDAARRCRMPSSSLRPMAEKPCPPLVTTSPR